MSWKASDPGKAVIAAAGLLLVALALSPGHPPLAEDRARVSAVCLECHEGRDSTLAGGVHWPGAAHDGAEARVACTDCHPGDRKHWEEDPQQNPMTNPARVTAAAAARVCSACHQGGHQQNMIEKNVHTANAINCSGCHRVHAAARPAPAALLAKPEPGLCLDCHRGAAAQFARSFRHPVRDGVMRCTECHATLDRTRTDLSANGSNVCTTCHGEFEGPFPYEHAAALDFSTEEGGCLSCHEPHGSHLARMLRQPYEPPHYQLCTQCHSVPRHFSNPMHGTTWAGKACNDCHTDIHGSYDNRLFLDESLRGQGCSNSGCHQF